MGLKIRLRKQGRINRQFFRLVVTETGTKRDGKYIEALGWYDPHESSAEENLSLSIDRIAHWLNQGAELSDRAHALVKKGAPEVVRHHAEKQLAHKAKVSLKRKVRRKREAAKQ